MSDHNEPTQGGSLTSVPLQPVVLPFTVEDVEACWDHATQYLVDILNGEYDVSSAKRDLRSLIGSKWDRRQNASIHGARTL